MSVIRSEKTEYLRVLYNFSCGYCGITELEAGGTLTRDHFKPLTKGGRNSVDNMVYACADCNRAKGDYFGDTPATRLLHPLRDNLSAHLARDEQGMCCPLSALGAIYIQVLNLDRASSLKSRCST